MRAPSPRPLLLLLPASLWIAGVPAAQNWFDSPRILTDPTFGSTVEEIFALGDIDGDGDPDLVAADGASVRPLRNEGGEFKELAATPLGAGASLTTRPQVGDVDGDGRGDLVLLATSLPGAVHVHRGQADGTLAPAEVVPLPVQPVRFDLGDFNGDGRLDVAVAAGGGIGWIFYDGSTFQTSSLVNVGVDLWTVAAADFDGDELADVAVGHRFEPAVTLVPTQGGAPTLGALVPVAGGSGELCSPWHGDLDGDGDEDLLAITDDAFDLYFTPLLNDGSGGFAAGPVQMEEELGKILNSSEAHLGDWDGDGDDDLASQALAGGILPNFPVEAVLLENLGAGQLAEEVNFVLAQTGTPPGFADFDGDGFLDFCTNDSVLFGDGTFREPHAASLSAFRQVLDWEDDGDLDLFSGAIRSNDGTGTFSPLQPLLPEPPEPDQFYGGPVVFADLDGDGFRDVLASLNRDNGVFVPPDFLGMRLIADDGSLDYVDVALAAPAETAIVGVSGRNFATDVDLDGDVDLVLGRSTIEVEQEAWLNDGTGFFPSAPVTLFAGFALDMADVDDDGDMDFLQMNTAVVPRPLSLARNDGGLSFQSTDLMTSADVIEDTARFADLDDDGDLDVVTSVRATRGFFFAHDLFAIENLGGASFAAPVLVGSTSEDVAVVGAGDADGDGQTDVLAGTTTPDTQAEKLIVARRAGRGLVYEDLRLWYQRSASAFADVDSDGDVDAIGSSLVRSRAFEAPDSGFARQYGEGVAGTGGAVPVLGAQGPFDPASTSIEIRLRRAVGGSFGLLLFGTLEAAIPNFGVPGATGHVLGFFPPVPITVGGAGGVAGAGAFTLPVSPGPALIGSSFFHQIFVVDGGAPFGVTATNGLEIRYGL